MDDRNEMPPIDEELHRAMENLLRKQVPCRRVHFLLIFQIGRASCRERV